jgi:hypothetical protein
MISRKMNFFEEKRRFSPFFKRFLSHWGKRRKKNEDLKTFFWKFGKKNISLKKSILLAFRSCRVEGWRGPGFE